MAYENELRLIGNLGADPEVVPLENGIIAKIRVGQTKKWRDRGTNEPRERTDWFYIDVFGQNAKFVAEYFQKGMLVQVKAGIRTRTWDDNGTPRYVLDIVVAERDHKVQILSNAQKQQSEVQRKPTHQSKPQNQDQTPQHQQHLPPELQGGYGTPSESQPAQSNAQYAPPPNQSGSDSNWNEDRPFGN